MPWKLRFPRVVRWYGGDANAVQAVLPDTVATYRRKGCEAWLSQRGRSWVSIATELYESGELLDGDGGGSNTLEEEEEDDEGSRCFKPKRARLDDGGERRVGVEMKLSEAWSLCGEDQLRAARNLYSQENYEEALRGFSGLAEPFTRATDVLERLTAESIRREHAAGQITKNVVDVDSAAEGRELLAELNGMAAAFSGVAGTLECLKRPLNAEEVKEALRMRLRAVMLLQDAVEHGQIGELKVKDKTFIALLQIARNKPSTLCERDEVKDFLHGLLVAKMDELHRRRPDLVKDARSVMSDPERR